MKLLRYGPEGQEKPGLLDADGRIRDLSGVVADIGPPSSRPTASPGSPRSIPASLPLVEGDAAATACRSRARASSSPSASTMPTMPPNRTCRSRPSRWSSPRRSAASRAPNDPVMIPRGSTKTDWEVELGVVIGSRASYVEEADALDHVAGYCVVNDMSERDFQLNRGGTWDKGKGCDTFGPVGPWLVTADEVGDPQDLAMWLDVNGRRVQDGSTRTMIFGVAKIVSYLSEFMTLEPGDIITTGTPPGVGMGQKPEPWYPEGRATWCTLGIEKLGEQRQDVVAFGRDAGGGGS